MSKKLYAVGIGYKKDGKIIYVKAFLYISEKDIFRSDYDDIIKNNFNHNDYDNLINLHVSSTEAIVSIFMLDALDPNSDEKIILLVQLFANGDFNSLDNNDDSYLSKLHSSIASWYTEGCF